VIEGEKEKTGESSKRHSNKTTARYGKRMRLVKRGIQMESKNNPPKSDESFVTLGMLGW
jgi:hypothetical protein